MLKQKLLLAIFFIFVTTTLANAQQADYGISTKRFWVKGNPPMVRDMKAVLMNPNLKLYLSTPLIALGDSGSAQVAVTHNKGLDVFNIHGPVDTLDADESGSSAGGNLFAYLGVGARKAVIGWLENTFKLGHKDYNVNFQLGDYPAQVSPDISVSPYTDVKVSFWKQELSVTLTGELAKQNKRDAEAVIISLDIRQSSGPIYDITEIIPARRPEAGSMNSLSDYFVPVEASTAIVKLESKVAHPMTKHLGRITGSVELLPLEY